MGPIMSGVFYQSATGGIAVKSESQAFRFVGLKYSFFLRKKQKSFIEKMILGFNLKISISKKI
jgi:hypothetical protein